MIEGRTRSSIDFALRFYTSYLFYQYSFKYARIISINALLSCGKLLRVLSRENTRKSVRASATENDAKPLRAGGYFFLLFRRTLKPFKIKDKKTNTKETFRGILRSLAYRRVFSSLEITTLWRNIHRESEARRRDADRGAGEECSRGSRQSAVCSREFLK